MYRMFYDRELRGDTLFILMNPEASVTKTETKGNVIAEYHDNELVGVKILALSKILKIKAHGMIVTPGEELVNVVNAILKGAGIAALPYCTDSGYRVAKVLKIEECPEDAKKNVVKVDAGGKVLSTLTPYHNLAVGQFVVLATDGTIQYNGVTFKKSEREGDCLICNAKELRISSEKEGAFLVEGYQSGEDFYLGGE